jgi:serine/threonine protein kinase
MLSLEGRQLGNYTVMRRIRSGGMGAVYEGRQRSAFDRRVAIKVILGSYASDPEMRRRFAREARTVARLHHPHILPLIEFGDEQGVLYLVMPFIEGGTLTGYLRRHLPEIHEVSTIFLQLLDAVEYAHDEGLIHRDIKSSNVLLESRRSGPPYAYLADFGLVRAIPLADGYGVEPLARGSTPTPATPIPLDQVPGTPHYMAPEQTLGIVTPATDIYALGVLLYQLLTGELPYNDPDDVEVIKLHLYAPVPNPRDADASIPAELGAVVERAMAKHAEERFVNVGDFREAFLAAIVGPLANAGDSPFADDDDDDDFAIHELPQRPSLSELPPRPLRASQQLNPPSPAPIEFSEPPPTTARRQRITDDPNEAAPPAARAKRQRRITGENDEAPWSATDKRPPHAAISPIHSGGSRARTGDLEWDEPVDKARGVSNLRGPVSLEAEARNTVSPTAGKRQPALDQYAPEPSPVHSTGGPRARSGGAGDPVGPGRGRSAQPRKKRRRLRVAVLAGSAVPVLLILLLLVPRAFGLSLLPAGFPLLGTTPVATISLTVKTTTVRDTFLLTASPQARQEEVNAHIIPDRSATASVNANRTVATSGLQASGGTRGSGTLYFDNSGHTPVSISAGFTFTASNGVQVRLIGGIIVPARANGADGTARAQATAVEAGQDGNLPAGILNMACCGGNVNVINPAAFSGGSNPGVTHLVAQSDLDGVANALTPGLRQQAMQALGGQLQAGEVQAGTPSYSVNITSDHPVGSSATQVTVTVSLSVAALIYNTRAASDLVRQLLAGEAAQSLGPGYQPHGSLTIATPTVEQQGSANQLYLSVSASGLWAYAVTTQAEEQWRQAIKGASIPLAQSYLSTRPGILAARIQLPFGSDHLPTDGTRLVFVVGS